MPWRISGVTARRAPSVPLPPVMRAGGGVRGVDAAVGVPAGPERGTLAPLELAAPIGREPQERLRPAARTDEGPEHERKSRDAEDQGRDEDPRHRSASVSRRIRSRIAGSRDGTVPSDAGRRVHRRTSTATIARPTATAASGANHTRRLNPRRRGERRIHSPYRSTKYWTTSAGLSPASSRSRTITRI